MPARTLSVRFSQRPSSGLKPHQRTFRLRKPLAISEVQVRIARGARFADLHKLFGQYAIELHIDALKLRWALSESVTIPKLLSWGRADISLRPAGLRISVALVPPDSSIAEPARLLSRAEGGTGFMIQIEIRGNTLCPGKKDCRRAGAGKTRRTK
jgi:hypothetical protein